MPIASSDKSFVTFNDLSTICGTDRQSALPAYETFDIAFQFKVMDELLPDTTVFKAAVCSPECELLYNPDLEAIPLCNRHTFVFGAENEILTEQYFPILVGNYSPQPGQPQIPEGTYTYDEFLQIINDLYEVNLPGYDYVSCCEEPVISDIVVFLNGAGPAEEVSLGTFYYTGYVNFPAATMNGRVEVGDCFRYCILDDGDQVISCSNLFYRTLDDCKTTVFRYWNDENGFGFNYVTYDDNGVTRITENRVRLSVNFYEVRTPTTENVIRLPSGNYQRVSTTIEEQWRAQAAPLSAEQIVQLTGMLKHDHLYVINEEVGFDGFMTQIGEPEPDYNEGIRRPTNMVYFNIFNHSATNVNRNCGGECGIELISDCDGDGGVVIPCPDKFNVEYQVPEGETQQTYQNDGLIGMPASQLTVYREGLYQYQVTNDYTFDNLTGTITWNPELFGNERISIWEA